MLIKQMFISAVSSATLLSSGMNVGFSAVSLPHMLDPNGPDKLTVDQGSWFASITFITILAGCLTCGPLLDKLGRRRTLLLVNIPFVLGWALQWLAPTPAPVHMLYLGRLLNGLGGGMVSIPANIYIAEISSNKMRCMLITWPSIAFSIGVLLVYGLGLVTSDWRAIAAISTFIPVFTAVYVYSCVGESPFWLLSRGRQNEAEEAFRYVHTCDDRDSLSQEDRSEFESMLKKTNELRSEQEEPLRNGFELSYGANGTNDSGKEADKDSTVVGGLSSAMSTLKRRDVWKPLVILNSYFFFMQFSGVPVLIAYAVNIIMSEGVSLNPYFATLLVGLVKLFSEIIAGFVQNRYGRRPMSIGSGIGMALCMVALGLQHQFMSPDNNTQYTPALSWIPLLLIFAYVISAAMGFFLLPWAMLGEVYPTEVVGVACGITTCLGNLFGFVAIKLFPNMVVLLGGAADNNTINCTEGVFYLYGGITCISVIFIFFFLPETFRRTIQEISQEFVNPSRKFTVC
ncbi:hypothetical protein L9F63_023557 [Diploptera punctata]|uniref:Major facilitator superfamily (MFS) profile domain-containing protein n=1 Tax=Diploptera punctata TaxID=6984 RepID=A0AAD8E961_DIPPU|nr:hypothetical protein L9F63_023557 [Diploptera punctata]